MVFAFVSLRHVPKPRFGRESSGTPLSPKIKIFGDPINRRGDLCGESGEAIDLVKKWMMQGHELDKAHLAKELGDIAWYLAEAATAIGYDLETILQNNIDKLKARYPEGFDAERSMHRKNGDE